MSIRIKTKSEIEKIKKASEIIMECFELVEKNLKAGMSTKELDIMLEDLITKRGGRPASKGYNGFPEATCISVNEELIHGIPKKNKILKEKDIVSCDIMVEKDGYYSDASRTFTIGNVSDEVLKLIKVTRESFFEAVKFVKPGAYLNDIGTAVQKYVEKEGFNVVRDYIGHGVGHEIHEEPEVPNYDTGRRGPRLTEGMVLAIEPMVSMGTYKTEVLDDDWTVVMEDRSLCAHYENTVLVTANGHEILTLREEI